MPEALLELQAPRAFPALVFVAEKVGVVPLAIGLLYTSLSVIVMLEFVDPSAVIGPFPVMVVAMGSTVPAMNVTADV